MDSENKKHDSLSGEAKDDRKKQQQSDPQLTELAGFVDPDEKLEPDLEDDDTGKDSTKKP